MSNIKGKVNWTAVSNLIKKTAENILEDVSEQLTNRLKENSPIGDPSTWKYPAYSGYIPGDYKAAWSVELTGNKMHIVNNMPYAERIEYGWSQQAPTGVLRLTLKELPIMFKTAAQRHRL